MSTEPVTPHRRRTPCCEIEAFRYLEGHDDAWAAGMAEAREQGAKAERERIAAAVEELAPTVPWWNDADGDPEKPDGHYLDRAAVLAALRGEEKAS